MPIKSTLHPRISSLISATVASSTAINEDANELMEEFRLNPTDPELYEICFLLILARAAKAASQYANRIAYASGLMVELANGDLVHDIAMDTTCKVMDALQLGQACTTGLIATTANNLMTNALNGARARAGITEALVLKEEALAEDAPVLDDVAGPLSQLPEKLREILTLTFFDGLTLKEAADRLGCSLSKAFRLKQEGLEEMRLALT
jgi:DNA-directed RNA polymerase specialized sigma24 family protein